MTLQEQAAKAVSEANFGTASARKTGRNPQWPYVPVVVLPAGQQAQILRKAFATRIEAVAFAEAHLDHLRESMATRLLDPRNRALREYYGLPREI